MAFELFQRSSNAQQLRRNNLCNICVQGPTYNQGGFVVLQYPVVKLGWSPKLSSAWRGPYRVFDCLNAVTYRIEESSNGTVQVVHCDRMKGFHGPVPTASNVTKCTSASSFDSKSPVASSFDHSQCGHTLLQIFTPSVTSPDPRNRKNSAPIPTATPVSDFLPNCTIPSTLFSPTIRTPVYSSFFSKVCWPRTPYFAILFIKRQSNSSPRKRQSWDETFHGTTFVHSPSRLESHIDGSSQNLLQHFNKSPQ